MRTGLPLSKKNCSDYQKFKTTYCDHASTIYGNWFKKFSFIFVKIFSKNSFNSFEIFRKFFQIFFSIPLKFFENISKIYYKYRRPLFWMNCLKSKKYKNEVIWPFIRGRCLLFLWFDSICRLSDATSPKMDYCVLQSRINK